MKRTHKIAIGLIGSLSLGLAAAVAHAHPGRMGAGMGPMAMHGGMGPGAMGGMGPMGMRGGMGPGMMGGMGPMGMRSGMGPGGAGAGIPGAAAMQQLMTPEEHTATINKMRNAATPEERQKIADATRAEMQKRAKRSRSVV